MGQDCEVELIGCGDQGQVLEELTDCFLITAVQIISLNMDLKEG